MSFYVHKRNDGYVFATTYRCKDYKPFGRDEEVKFELLGVFEKWDNEVIDLIKRERKASPYHAKDVEEE